jgi:hypothetical protein
MSITQLKAEIVEQVSKMESEKALLEIRDLLETLNKNSEPSNNLKESSKAETLFEKAVQQYGTVLEKLAQ